MAEKVMKENIRVHKKAYNHFKSDSNFRNQDLKKYIKHFFNKLRHIVVSISLFHLHYSPAHKWLHHKFKSINFRINKKKKLLLIWFPALSAFTENPTEHFRPTDLLPELRTPPIKHLLRASWRGRKNPDQVPSCSPLSSPSIWVSVSGSRV